MKLFYRLTPHFHLSSNPLFALETRHLPNGSTAQALISDSGKVVLIVCAALLAIWLLLTLAYPRRLAFQTPIGLEFTLIAAALSMLLNFILDILGILAAFAGSFEETNADNESRELLRLTPLTAKDMVISRHGAAQVRVWRVMTFIVASRIAVVLMLVLDLLYEFFRVPGYVLLTDTLSSMVSFFSSILVFVLVVAAAVLGIFEPYWRMKALIALGVAVSAHALSPVSRVLRAVWALVLFWLGQVLLIGGVVICFWLILTGGTGGYFVKDAGAFMSLSVFILLFLVSGYYSVVQTSALRRAERFTAQPH